MTQAAGLYIHVPFCRRKCRYCHFYSVEHPEERIPEFVSALTAEMAAHASEFGPFDTIYFGGGTPSLLDAGHMETILDAARRHFWIEADHEITVEVNPADRDMDWFAALRRLGVNRLSLGIQSFDDDVLAFLGRRHTAEQALRTFEAAVAAGFDNIGIDLIYAVPGQSLEQWQRVLQQALRLAPAHLSCYELSVEEGTPLAAALDAGEFGLPDEELQWDFFRTTSETLTAAGYIHYEVSNFARSTARFSRHNTKYWRHTPFLGLGPAAHSFRNGRRWWNHASLDDYVNDLARGNLPVAGSEKITPTDLRFEALFLGLRTAEGIDIDAFQREFGLDLEIKNRELLAALRQDGLIAADARFIRPTLRGLAVADRLAASLHV